MAYSELQAERLRAAIGNRHGVVTKRMMGSLVFMVDGNMLAGTRTVAGADRFMFRVGAVNMAGALRRSGATPAVMGGRTMKDFIFVADCDDAALAQWVRLALDFVETLPAK